MKQTGRRPNWAVWANVPDVKVWEAVALSLGIEPREVAVQRHAWMADSSDFPHSENQDFEDRLEVLRRNLGEEHGLPLESIIMGKPDYCKISIVAFAKWARRLKWEVPAELAALAPAAATSEPPVVLPRKPEPEPLKPSPVPQPLTVPEKVTLAWLWNHMPVAWWWWLAGGAVAVFAAGVSVGQSEFYARLTSRSVAAEAAKQPPAEPAATAPSQPPKIPASRAK